MKRRAVIISNPGEDGDALYCPGVLKDVENMRRFLTSPVGGLWNDSEEIIHHPRPTVNGLRKAIAWWHLFDYVLVLFTGHGHFCPDRRSTILALRKGEEIDVAELRLKAGRQTLIIDCCREQHRGLIALSAANEKFARTVPEIHPARCRKYYDHSLEQCPEELVEMYACNVDEKAGDNSSVGGVYTHNLLDASNDWVRNSSVDTTLQYDTLSVVQAHDLAIPRVTQERGLRQEPNIVKPRSGPYFPFCIVA